MYHSTCFNNQCYFGIIFFQAQHDMEMRIASLIEKIATIESIPPPPPPRSVPADVTSDPTSSQLGELEAQLANITNKRLDYLESMQMHQVDMQVLVMFISSYAYSVVSEESVL